MLDAIGPEAWYGLRVVELRQTEDFDRRSIVYGRTRTPGEILLYEQPENEASELQNFMRFDVLLHELGHHVLQHRARKFYSVRRTSEHERFAEMFARRWKPTVRAAFSRSALTE
ncbi:MULTISPECIES: ImmA/IrrE family metallo-endopeptidase [Catenuloplanes]|uniref:IrrE N-terminal-like domain-containing protein n=1 Tax=Catenuloplanes niger TaxID=587534 RepID=A0AAE3ZWK3_9ACTN|nr:hypothetical protein [Catenuloplanes niger]MDR7327394.1 hypothetical protein [Catenuloplanes niger]